MMVANTHLAVSGFDHNVGIGSLQSTFPRFVFGEVFQISSGRIELLEGNPTEDHALSLFINGEEISVGSIDYRSASGIEGRSFSQLKVFDSPLIRRRRKVRDPG